MNQSSTLASESMMSSVDIGDLANKVPMVTAFFWIIKILCTTVGETAADYLNDTMGFGLSGTTVIMSALLLVALGVQFRMKQYIPTVYWTCVVLISVVGTLITDNLTDHLGISLVVSTGVFAIMLVAVMAVWLAVEGTISIHSITTTRREFFYWLTVLFTFALGTAAGDLVAERWNLGYLNSLVLFGGLIAVIAVAHLRLGLNATVAFWMAYILTRPLGASLGDYLSQAREDGGLGLGTTVTSLLFLGAIGVLVIYLSATRQDREVVALESA